MCRFHGKIKCVLFTVFHGLYLNKGENVHFVFRFSKEIVQLYVYFTIWLFLEKNCPYLSYTKLIIGIIFLLFLLPFSFTLPDTIMQTFCHSDSKARGFKWILKIWKKYSEYVVYSFYQNLEKYVGSRLNVCTCTRMYVCCCLCRNVLMLMFTYGFFYNEVALTWYEYKKHTINCYAIWISHLSNPGLKGDSAIRHIEKNMLNTFFPHSDS